jgi:hypothetical protein
MQETRQKIPTLLQCNISERNSRQTRQAICGYQPGSLTKATNTSHQGHGLGRSGMALKLRDK